MPNDFRENETPYSMDKNQVVVLIGIYNIRFMKYLIGSWRMLMFEHNL